MRKYFIKFNKLNMLFVLILVTMTAISCKKFVDISSPVDKLTTKKIFADSTNATAAVLGIYIEMITANDGLLSGGSTVCGSLLSDELYPVNAPEEYVQFYTNSVLPSNNIANSGNLWRVGYLIIYRANACIEGLKESQGISESLKRQLTGEAKFIRALAYFYLANFYGDVPIVTSLDYQKNQSLPRGSVAHVYEQIVKDLTESKELVKENYFTTGRLRPNRAAVTSLLARVYLYQKQWAQAEDAATQVISQSNLYNLVTDLTKVFDPNSREAIWQISPVGQGGFETPDGRLFVPYSNEAIPRYNLTESLLTSFETNDGRRLNWVGKQSVNVSGQLTDFYYPFKYKIWNSGWTNTPLESYSMLRLSELYLIRAEARVQQNKIDPAKNDLNLIRNRAGLGNTGAITQEGILDAIYKEKQIEFFCEWGHRWLDLKRTGRINSVMPDVAISKGSTWNTNKQHLPIPFEQILANPYLVQNPGYN